jgi:hypothetical protein
MLEARLERLAVCVNVAKQADPHLIRSRRHAEFRRGILSLIVDNGVDLPQRRSTTIQAPLVPIFNHSSSVLITLSAYNRPRPVA